jgi:hypothetical protein
MFVALLAASLLLGCEPMATTVAIHPSPRAAIVARLNELSTNPVIQQSARHRFGSAASDPERLARAIASTDTTTQSVHAVLANAVDEVVIVDWLVSFGAMGAWTAYDPHHSEPVNVPVSDIPGLVAHSPNDVGVFRLRDHQHLMLVLPVVVDNETVGAVGFILARTYVDPTLAAAAVELQ